ncbi:hypothetical protein M5689_025454 [Euphorbia peplus]|nr:hypothetical protein M5689_025454 [Euphorbia peplus]
MSLLDEFDFFNHKPNESIIHTEFRNIEIENLKIVRKQCELVKTYLEASLNKLHQSGSELEKKATGYMVKEPSQELQKKNKKKKKKLAHHDHSEIILPHSNCRQLLAGSCSVNDGEIEEKSVKIYDYTARSVVCALRAQQKTRKLDN